MGDVEQKEQESASTKHRSLTDNEYHCLVRKLEQDTRDEVLEFHHHNRVRNRAAVLLMLQAGLRVEEVSQVTAEDIKIGERSGDVMVRNGKGGKQRIVNLNSLVRPALVSYLDLHPDSVTLFDLSTRSLQRIVNEIGHRIGIPDLTPHWLRYTLAKRLEKTGTSIEDIRKILGHKSIETTRIYLRSSMEELQSALEGVV
jgi:site-specific recombinase XerD